MAWQLRQPGVCNKDSTCALASKPRHGGTCWCRCCFAVAMRWRLCRHPAVMHPPHFGDPCLYDERIYTGAEVQPWAIHASVIKACFLQPACRSSLKRWDGPSCIRYQRICAGAPGEQGSETVKRLFVTLSLTVSRSTRALITPEVHTSRDCQPTASR